jgi:hypothetical protein
MASHHYSNSFAQLESSGSFQVPQDPVSTHGDSANPPALLNDDVEHGEHSDDDTTQPEDNDTDAPDNSHPETEHDYVEVVNLMNSNAFSQDQKQSFMNNYATSQLDRLYAAHMAVCGFQRVTIAFPSATDNVTEDTYLPLDPNNGASPDPRAPRPLYPAYTGHFRTAQAASTHRKRTRVAPKSNAPDIDRVKRYGRKYLWL